MSKSKKPEDLVKRFHTRDPFIIAKGLKIECHTVNHPESRLPGMTCLVRNRPSIYINQSYFDAQQSCDPNYTDAVMADDIMQVMAHELGHALLDRKTLRVLPIFEYEIFNVRTPMEVRANEFAARIRIDTDLMKECFSEGMDLLSIAATLHVNINLLIYMIHQMNRTERLEWDVNQLVPNDKFMGSLHGGKSGNGL